MSDMGTFRVDIWVENPLRPGDRRLIHGALVDTGAEMSLFPSEILDAIGIDRYEHVRLRQASGAIIERWIGPAFVHVAGKRATDDVIFGEQEDLVLLGARSLEGLNLRVDARKKQLVDAGPILLAAAS